MSAYVIDFIIVGVATAILLAITLFPIFIVNPAAFGLIGGLITSTDLHQKYSDRIANTTVA